MKAGPEGAGAELNHTSREAACRSKPEGGKQFNFLRLLRGLELRGPTARGAIVTLKFLNT
ncbi:MAG: hypothetical protein NVS9B4_22980 [Candidatus Acidiferrum sp.]